MFNNMDMQVIAFNAVFFFILITNTVWAEKNNDIILRAFKKINFSNEMCSWKNLNIMKYCNYNFSRSNKIYVLTK